MPGIVYLHPHLLANYLATLLPDARPAHRIRFHGMKGGFALDTTAIPSIFLHNFIAVIGSLLLTIALRIRWLVTLIAWGVAFGTSFLWEKAGYEWHVTWKTYLYDPVLEGGLWHDSASDAEVFGLFLFWLMPLALAYMVALARIAKIER